LKISKLNLARILLTVLLVATLTAIGGCQKASIREDETLKAKMDTATSGRTYETLGSVTMDNAAIKSEAFIQDAPEGAVVTNPGGEINGHKLIAENANYELYFLEESLSIIIRNKETGAIIESIVNGDVQSSNIAWQSYMKSGVVLQALKGINIVPTTVDIRKAKKDVTIMENGFSANVYYEEFGLGYQLNVSLTDDGLVVEIPDDSIIEETEEYKIGELYIYPFMGYTYLGERTGYMLIPDGNGALIYLEDNEGRFSSAFSQYVYGANIGVDESYALSLFKNRYQSVNEANKIMAPVFGMVHTDTKFGFLGIIESGAYSAKIEAYPNGAYTDYNWICSKYVYRQVYVQPTGQREGSVTIQQPTRNEVNARVVYRFVSGDEANYTGLAHTYRDYLIKTDEINVVGDDFNIRLDFLGIDKENWLIFKRNVTMTTVDNIREIYNELKQEGVTDILSIYKGWQKNGIYSVPITSYKADGDIGGNKELSRLIEDCKKQGIDFYLAQDALRVNPSLKNANFNIIKKITKRVYEEETYKDVFPEFRYLTPARSKQNLEKAANSYRKNKIENIMLSGITDILFTYTHKGVIYDRTNTARTYEEAIAGLDNDFNFVMEKPFSYLWKYTDAIVDMPVVSSNYIFSDEEVPFLTIALKGIIPMYAEYTNFEADKNEFFLKLVEMGVNPSFYITYEDPAELQYTNSNDVYSAKYSIYKDTIVKYYKALKEVYDKTQGSYITEHKAYNNGLTIVTYDNGVKIYVNYNETMEVNVDGYSIGPMSYKVGE